MKNKLSCAQVIELLSFYSDEKLNSKLRSSVEEHLKTCASCREIYSLRFSKIDVKRDKSDVSDNIWDNLSAYVDNELDSNEAVRIRKIAITNPLVRKNLEDMYSLKREIHNSFLRTKSECKTDYSKMIIGILNGENKGEPFQTLVWTFTAMLSVLIAGFIVMLYF